MVKDIYLDAVGNRDPWVQTPKWHPRYWFGHRVRQWDWTNCYSPHDGQWKYLTHQQHAMQVLAEIAHD